ncbi:unnamed protein product [Symbiodinium microadriaticum]|nr:unnamed protein product [Symbiodinium microadriaticum]
MATKIKSLIDILSVLQVEVTTLCDSTGPDFALKVISMLEGCRHKHKQHKHGRMELTTQQHALKNHVKQVCSLSSNVLTSSRGRAVLSEARHGTCLG